MSCSLLKVFHEAVISNDPEDVILVAIEILHLRLSQRLSYQCDILIVHAALPRDSICFCSHLLKSEASA